MQMGSSSVFSSFHTGFWSQGYTTITNHANQTNSAIATDNEDGLNELILVGSGVRRRVLVVVVVGSSILV